MQIATCSTAAPCPTREERGLFTNRSLLLGVAVMIGLQVLFTYAPFMNTLFASAPLNVTQWAPIVLLAILTFLVVEGEKALRARAARHTKSAAGEQARVGIR